MSSYILYERRFGITREDIECRWGVSNLEDFEERRRDDMLWLLGGVGKLCELGCLLYHLAQHCNAGTQQVHIVGIQIKRMRRQVFDLMEQIKYCSAFRPMLRSIKHTKSNASGPVIGVQTIRKLEESGITSIGQLVEMTTEHLISLGVRKDLAKQIYGYIRRRNQ